MSPNADQLSAVRVAGNRDRRAVGAALSRAFADDPAMAWIFPDPATRAARLPALFRLLFDTDATRGIRLVTDGAEAATFWRGPGVGAAGTVELLFQAWPMLRIFGTALGRAMAVSGAIEDHMPPGDYWYLHIAGCDPAAQGQGFGAAAVRSGLDRVAGSGLPAYLETANQRNLGFYQALGFSVTGEWAVPKGGPRFWSMLRPAA